jgi:murein L,D-transpeptidase YafK
MTREGSRIRRTCRPVAAILFVLLALAASGASRADELGKADRVLVLKGRRELQLLRGDVILRSYPIALGRHPNGPKRRRGDGRTPEGVYVIDRRLDHSAYHLALHISYPNEADRASAHAAHVAPGSGIWIHGMPARFGRTDPGRFFRDWTKGCISVGNVAIEEIWDAVDDGTVIEIRP